MIKPQTIVMSLDHGRVFEESSVNEETKEDEKFFTSTDFDFKIMEFCDGILQDGGAIVALQFFATNEYLIAFILYSEKPLQMPGQSGNIVVPDLKLT